MSTKRRHLAPEVRSRRAAKRRRTRSRRGMTKMDKMISKAYLEAIANDPCFYCGRRRTLMHNDHFYSLARGGNSAWTNMVRACQECNTAKGTMCGFCFVGQKCDTGCKPPNLEVCHDVKKPLRRVRSTA